MAKAFFVAKEVQHGKETRTVFRKSFPETTTIDEGMKFLEKKYKGWTLLNPGDITGDFTINFKDPMLLNVVAIKPSTKNQWQPRINCIHINLQ